MSNKTRIALESLSLDLKRVALGYNRGSDKMAQRFAEEAIKRKNEINADEVKLYIATLLQKLEEELSHSDKSRVAENSLMLSTLFQNYAQSQAE